ncbi:uroporphyrinogen-III C-methyltransferase [soil metagenome]
MTAVVHLVGAGPGDPGLLTRRAAGLLAAADVVVADRPSMDDVVALAPARAERRYVGTVGPAAAWSTGAVVELLATAARAGRRVVRLKSGDPFTCSRGAEEVAALGALGIACEVTPGVTSATAGPLAAGVRPGRTLTVASGDDDPAAAPVDWAALADPSTSLVVLTGRAHQGRIADALTAAGLPADTPANIVHAAGRPGTVVASTTVAGLGTTRLPPPAMAIVGPDPVTVTGTATHPAPGGHRAHT